MAHFAKVIDNKVVNVIAASQSFIDNYDDGLGGEWIKTSYNTFGGKHYDPETGLEDSKPAIRKNFAGLDYTYDRDNDAFIPPTPFPSFVFITMNMVHGLICGIRLMLYHNIIQIQNIMMRQL